MPRAERAGSPGVDHSGVIRAAGEASVTAGIVRRNGSLLSFDYEYRHTAVLTEEVRGISSLNPGVKAPAGAPGYYAGTFSMSIGSYRSPVPIDMWCFLPSVVGGTRSNICFARTSPGEAIIAPSNRNQYLWMSFAPTGGIFEDVTTPIYERREVEIPVDLNLEYVFERWTDDHLRLEERAVGRKVRDVHLPRNADGAAVLATVAGNFLISPVEGERRQATIQVMGK